MSEIDDEAVIERLEELKEQFDVESDEYADVSMTIQYLRGPDYYLPGDDR